MIKVEKVFWTGFTAWQGRAEKKLPYYPLEKLRRIQDRRVKAIVAFAYETVPFYREFMQREKLRPADFKTAGDLEKLPIIGSEDLSSNPGQFYSSAFDQSRVLSLGTSGSTGLNKVIHHDFKALFQARAGGHRARMVLSDYVGRSLGYKEVKVTRDGGTGLVILQFYKDHSWVPKAVNLKRAVTFPEDTFEENIRVINENEPEVINGFGSYIGGIYRWAWMHDVAIHRPKVIYHGGDTMQEPDRKLIENEYQVPVVSGYQACEALNIAFQCKQREGFHISMDQVTMRVVDREGNTLPPENSGEIVISNLINRATVLLNYRMGDLGQLSAQPCSCGRSLPTLVNLHGRRDDLVILSDGEAVHEAVILSRLYSVPGVMQVQVTQNSLTHFLIKVVCIADRNRDKERLNREVGDRFLEALGSPEGVSLDIETVDVIPQEENGKFRSVISFCSRN
jgi:phenylacetate-CoA ligase